MARMSITERVQAAGMTRAGTSIRQVARLFTVLRAVVDATVKLS